MDELSNQIENLKTDQDELEETLNEYDLDAELEQEFDAIDAEFRELEIVYQSLLNTRRFLNNAT
jgi:chromosome segregation ATPase